jgi:acetylornithine deacetylase
VLAIVECQELSMPDVERLLADLVSIPSMNPMGRNREGSAYSEAGIAEYVHAYLSSHGLDVQKQEVEPGRPNIVATVDVGAAQTCLLEAHLDTVHADNMKVEPFTPLVRDGKLFGRGACDTKGSLAAILYTASSLLQRPQALRYNLVIATVCDEEYRFAGAQKAVELGLRADCGIAGEPTALRIVRAHKGVARWRIFAHGKAAHSAYPERGENAIYVMGRILNRLELYAEGLRAASGHPTLGNRTLSVGVIEGGQAVNIVPDSCWIEIDRRTLPGETREAILTPIRSLLDDLDGWTMEEPHLMVAGMDVPEDSSLVENLGAAVKEVLGDVVVETAHYATDAGIYNGAGIPTVVFGPGDIAHAHTDTEYVELEQLHRSVAILERFLA